MISFISEIQSPESLTNCSNIALSPFLDVDTEKSPKDLDLEIDDAKSLFICLAISLVTIQITKSLRNKNKSSVEITDKPSRGLVNLYTVREALKSNFLIQGKSLSSKLEKGVITSDSNA